MDSLSSSGGRERSPSSDCSGMVSRNNCYKTLSTTHLLGVIAIVIKVGLLGDDFNVW